MIIGVDDAGRGPLIGPMIMAGVLLRKGDQDRLKKMGVRDSKQLVDHKREALAEEIRKTALGHKVLVIYPSEIDEKINGGFNLNKIEAVKSAEIINELFSRAEDAKKADEKVDVVVDCPSPNITKWKAYLIQHISEHEKMNFFIEHKADVNHIACSAASILAKSKREEEVALIKKKIGKDFGSGYTSDPVTQKFLQDYAKEHKKDGIFRQTWQTWKKDKGKKEQKSIGEF